MLGTSFGRLIAQLCEYLLQISPWLSSPVHVPQDPPLLITSFQDEEWLVWSELPVCRWWSCSAQIGSGVRGWEKRRITYFQLNLIRETWLVPRRSLQCSVRCTFLRIVSLHVFVGKINPHFTTLVEKDNIEKNEIRCHSKDITSEFHTRKRYQRYPEKTNLFVIIIQTAKWNTGFVWIRLDWRIQNVVVIQLLIQYWHNLAAQMYSSKLYQPRRVIIYIFYGYCLGKQKIAGNTLRRQKFYGRGIRKFSENPGRQFNSFYTSCIIPCLVDEWK